MSLFGSKRRRPPNSQPLTSNTAHSDAATAALSAFSSLHHRQSPPSLSEAAAAAALKARPRTPTDVSSVVPRRRNRRAGSANSSHGTASPHPSLRRSVSSGSMGERTFRSPSPHGRQPLVSPGPNSNGVAHVADFDGAPPVPSIPAGVQALPESREQKQPQNSGSMRIAAPPVRVASQKLKQEGQGTWFGGPAVGDLENTRTSDSLMLTTSTQSQDPITRPESRTSVNFSYPARQRVGSPPVTPLAEEAPSTLQLQQRDTDLDGPARTTSKRASATTSPPPRQATPRQRPSSMPDANELVYDRNSRRMVPKAELLALEQILNGVEPRQAPKQKRLTRSGSHLAKGTIGRTQGSAVSSTRQEAAPANIGSTNKPLVGDQITAHTSDKTHASAPVLSASSENRQGFTSAKDGTAEAKPRSMHYVQRSKDYTTRSSAPRPEVQSQKKEIFPPSSPPSLQTQSQERIRSPPPVQNAIQADATNQSHAESSRAALNVLDSVTSRQHVHTRPERAAPPSTVEEPQHTMKVSQLPQDPPAERLNGSKISENVGVTDLQSAHAEKLRSLSTSPMRVAHFGPVQRNLSVRHSPPPRSISPRKSALKQYSSPRNGSPRGGSSADDASEIGAANLPGEPSIQRKKSARVSFDDREMVLDDSDSSDAAPLQTESPRETKTSSTGNRRKWFSNIGRSKKADDTNFNDDEVMKPRPALPSFGSVRGEKKKHVEEHERPLVTPSETTYSPSLPDSPSMQSLSSPVNDQSGGTPLGQSTDRAIASVIASDYASRFPANTSRYREPLPPVVTSREGGYLSMSSDSSSESDMESFRDTPALSTQHSAATSVPDVESEQVPTKLATVPEISIDTSSSPLDRHVENLTLPTDGTMTGSTNSSPVPSISVTEASPHYAKVPSLAEEKLDVPGGFPDEDSDETIQGQPEPATVNPILHKASESIARQTITEPVAQTMDSTKTNQTPATVTATTSPAPDHSDSEGTSIYSDAYEDLSDIDEHGFQSLDAVVESPISVGGGRDLAHSREVSSQPSTKTSGLSEEADAPASGTSPPVDDWETAKAYWRSLTADKRAQLEREANEEAGADADLEQEAQDETRKPRRKKSVEKRQAEKQAILEAQRNPERSYMIQPGTKVPDEIQAPSNSILRTSMRQKAPEDVAPVSVSTNGRLRKSMRASVPAPEPVVQAPVQRTRLQLATSQPSSLTTKAAAGAAHRVHRDLTPTSPTAAAPPPRSGTMSSFFPPVLKRRGSTSSESSFRRSATRRATTGSSTGESGGFSLRRTMRGSAAEQPESLSTNQRLSLRSFSPPDSLRGSQKAPPPPVSMQGSRMRTSLRDSGAKSKMGVKSGSGSGISLSSFGLKSKAKGRGSGSRFGDSSDDDDAAGGGFRSRFEDSSDDEIGDVIPKPLTGGLGAKTMRTGRSNAAAYGAEARPQPVQEESPDLPDSSEEELTGRGAGAATTTISRPTRQASTFGGAQPQRTRSGRGSLGTAPALGTSLMRNGSGSGGNVSPINSPPSSPTSRRGSFMAAVLGRRKTSAPSSPIQRGELMDSAARRDTALERTPAELASMRRSPGPKLQRRTTAPAGRNAEEWPLATPLTNEEQQSRPREPERPSSAGNLLTGTRRPRILKTSGRSMSHGDVIVGAVNGGDGGVVVVHGDNVDEIVPAVENEPIPPKTKKKKFGALRRMFRLDD